MLSTEILKITKSLRLFICLLFFIFISKVSSGANDLHFYDGASTADVIAGDIFFEILDPPELRYSYRIRPAKDFGTPFNGSVHFEKTKLVPTVPLHSCSDIVNSDELFGNIALSERGECSFVFKTLKAQQAGAQAIIITESVDKWDDALDHLIEMVDDKMDLDVNIPAGFLLGRSGATILRTLKRLHKKYALVNLPINMTHVHLGKMNQPPWISCAMPRNLRAVGGSGGGAGAAGSYAYNQMDRPSKTAAGQRRGGGQRAVTPVKRRPPARQHCSVVV